MRSRKRQTLSPPNGVLIREVVPGSAAAKAGLQPDRIITHVNGHRVNSPAEYLQEMARAKGEAELTLLEGDGGSKRVTLPLPSR